MMKKLIILVLIALVSAPGQEVRYTRTDWPTPEEIRQDLGIPETDPLEAFTFDSALALEPLDSTEIAVLEAARWAYYLAVKDSFPDMGWQWWDSSVHSWMSNACDSLITIGHSPGIWVDLVMQAGLCTWYHAYQQLMKSFNHPEGSPERIKLQNMSTQALDTFYSLPCLPSYLP